MHRGQYCTSQLMYNAAAMLVYDRTCQGMSTSMDLETNSARLDANDSGFSFNLRNSEEYMTRKKKEKTVMGVEKVNEERRNEREQINYMHVLVSPCIYQRHDYTIQNSTVQFTKEEHTASYSISHCESFVHAPGFVERAELEEHVTEHESGRLRWTGTDHRGHVQDRRRVGQLLCAREKWAGRSGEGGGGRSR